MSYLFAIRPPPNGNAYIGKKWTATRDFITSTCRVDATQYTHSHSHQIPVGEQYQKLYSRKSKNHSPATNVHLDPDPAETPVFARNGLQDGILFYQRVGLIPRNTHIYTVIKCQLRNMTKKLIQHITKMIHQPVLLV